MSDYAKKTVAELQEVLKSRGLPSSGKKADLVARLTEADKAAETTVATEPAPAEPVAAPEPPQEQLPPPETATATQTDGQANETVAESTAPAAEAKDYALNLAASEVEAEMEKRKARAARFQTAGNANAEPEATETATVDTDALKHLERAKRFGMGSNAIGKLDQALPTERERGPRNNKRGPMEEASALDDPGLKRPFDRRGHSVSRRNGGPGKPTGVGKPSANAYSSEKDRAAADARKKRFTGQ